MLGAAQYDGTPSPVFAGRLDHAALLFEQGRAASCSCWARTSLAIARPRPRRGATTWSDRGCRRARSSRCPLGRLVVHEPAGRRLARCATAELSSAFLVSDPWHNARIQRMASDLGIEGHASATWTSAARTEETRLSGYVRETFAYLYYRVVGRAAAEARPGVGVPRGRAELSVLAATMGA